MATDDEAIICEYEQIRARNIERNNAHLRALGLISADEEAESNAVAWNKKVETKVKTASASSNDKKRKQRDSTVVSVGRKSLRLQGKQPDGLPIPDDKEPELADNDLVQRQRRARVQECREVRLRRAAEIAEKGAEQAAKENPTASYEHCLMRVQTMTEKGLANRVRVIERAAGKHSVIKMAIFKCCLQDEGMWDLAEVAGQALERLKALKEPDN